MNITKGTKVRVSYEAEYVRPFNYTGPASIVTDGRTLFDVPADATIEPIEDLRDRDLYLDAAGDVYEWHSGNFLRPGSGHAGWEAKRPLTLLVRDGQPVTS